jgi:hypothetical protein
VNYLAKTQARSVKSLVSGAFILPALFGMMAPAWSQTRAAPAQMTPAAAAAQASAVSPLPSGEAMVVMIRSALLALSHANTTNNYSVLNSLGTRSFQAKNPPRQLASAFQAFRENRIDMSPVVAIAPQLSLQPAVSNGTLRLVGAFPSRPMQVNFDLNFVPEDGAWKMSDMAVNLTRPQ